MNDSNTNRFPAVCSQCGAETTVPFQPSGNRPIYCINCYRARKNGAGGGSDQREMHTAICASCGKTTQVPFTPSENRPVYCRECYMQQKGN